MPRAARIVAPKMIYHVVSRGNDRQWVFNDSEDFEKYIETCKRYKDRYGFKLYHWVLMNNHVHLVMETNEEGPLGKIMQGINLSYTLWFNKKNRYESFGKDASQRQRTYRDYVLSHRDSEEQELRVKMGRGVLGSEDFGTLIEKQIIEYQRPKRGRPGK